MDKELANLQKEVIKRLIEYEDQLIAAKNPNQLKKTRRVSSSVAMNIAAFPDMIQDLLDSGKSTADITRSLRNFQESLLRDIVRIKGTETGHHITQLRTGGSFYRADPEIWQPVVSQLADFFQTEFGDVPENIRSYINYAHKSDTVTKGIEKAVIGATANPTKELTAHPFGTTARSLVADLSPQELEDPKELFNALAKRIDVQTQAVKTADKVQAPVVKAVQSFAPAAYTGGIEEARATQKLTALAENRQIIEEGILEAVNGSVRLRKAAGLLPLAGAAIGLTVAGGQAMAGDIEGAKVTAFETAAGEVPVVGDIFTADPAASGTLEGAQQAAMEVRRQEQQPKSAAAKILDDPLNELEYAGKQILGGLKTVGGAILFGF